MATKTGKYGKFRGCVSYPSCDFKEDYQHTGK
ncbi:topoisomerase DNA-binding C4 zinc finger domain-containing protein [Bacillus chungangensis]